MTGVCGGAAPETGTVASGAAMGAEGPLSSGLGAGCHPQNAAPANPPHPPTLAANTLIREEFFQSPILFRGTSSSLTSDPVGYPSPPMGSIAQPPENQFRRISPCRFLPTLSLAKPLPSRSACEMLALATRTG